jgi:hypothetical protein
VVACLLSSGVARFWRLILNASTPRCPRRVRRASAGTTSPANGGRSPALSVYASMACVAACGGRRRQPIKERTSIEFEGHRHHRRRRRRLRVGGARTRLGHKESRAVSCLSWRQRRGSAIGAEGVSFRGLGRVGRAGSAGSVRRRVMRIRATAPYSVTAASAWPRSSAEARSKGKCPPGSSVSARATTPARRAGSAAARLPLRRPRLVPLRRKEGRAAQSSPVRGIESGRQRVEFTLLAWREDLLVARLHLLKADCPREVRPRPWD